MAVRYQQAVHIRAGEPAEEEPVNTVTDDGDFQVFRCDLPLMDEAHAQDAFNTLSDHNVLGQALELDGEGAPSRVDRHVCYHDESPPEPCHVVQRAEEPDAE